MTPRPFPRCVLLFVWLFAALLAPAALYAQVTPAAGYTPPDDTPSIKVGATIFADYTYNKDPVTKDADGNYDPRRRLQRGAGLHQHHRQHLPHDRVPDHAGHDARELRRSHPRSGNQRQPGVPAEVRVRAVQPGRLDDARIVGPVRPPADALGGLHGRHLPVPLPGHDLHRARGLPDVVGQRRVVPLQLREELRRRARRVLQRRRVQQAGSQQSAGRSRFGAPCGRSRRPSRCSAAFASPASTTATTTSSTTRRRARSSRRRTSTSTSTPGTTTCTRPTSPRRWPRP